MKKTILFLFVLGTLFTACKKDNGEVVFQEDTDTKNLMRSYKLPNSAPEKEVSYIKGRYNGQDFYINDGDTNFPEFVVSKVEITQSNTVVVGGGGNHTSLEIRIGNHLEFPMPTIHLRTFPQKGDISIVDLWKKYVVIKDFPTAMVSNSDTEGWLVELLYPRPTGELATVGNPVSSSVYNGKTQPANRYFKITNIEKGDFANGKTQKITFKFDLDMFYVHRFSLFDRVENGEMVIYI